METFVNVLCWTVIIAAFVSKPYFDALISRNDGIYEKQGVDTVRAIIVILAVALIFHNSCS